MLLLADLSQRIKYVDNFVMSRSNQNVFAAAVHGAREICTEITIQRIGHGGVHT